MCIVLIVEYVFIILTCSRMPDYVCCCLIFVLFDLSLCLMMFLSMTSNLEADFSTVILPKTIYVMIGFFIGQLIDNFLSQPLIFSNSVKSHPLEIFIVILAGGTLMGTTGMIVAIPLYTALKVIFKAFLSGNKIVKSLTQDL